MSGEITRHMRFSGSITSFVEEKALEQARLGARRKSTFRENAGHFGPIIITQARKVNKTSVLRQMRSSASSAKYAPEATSVA